MSGEMQYKQAPKDHLKTWAGLIKVSAWTCAGVVLLLVILAITLVQSWSAKTCNPKGLPDFSPNNIKFGKKVSYLGNCRFW